MDINTEHSISVPLTTPISESEDRSQNSFEIQVTNTSNPKVHSEKDEKLVSEKLMEKYGFKPGPEISVHTRGIQQLNAQLNAAIKDEDAELFYRMLQNSASAKSVYRKGYLSALHIAVFFNRPKFIKELFKFGAILILDARGRNPLHLAALKGHLECLEALVDAYTDAISTQVDTTINHYDQEFNVNTFHAWDHDLKIEENEDEFIADGSTPLHLACRQLHIGCIELLLQRNADPNLKDAYNRTPIDMLIKSIDTIQRANYEMSTSEITVQNALITSSEKDEIVEEFNLKNQSSFSLERSVDVIKLSELLIFLIVNHDASKQSTATSLSLKSHEIDSYATQLLHTAVIMQEEKFLTFLMNRNIDIEVTIPTGDNPLHLAVRMKYTTSLEILLKAKNVTNLLEKKDNQGMTAILIAAKVSWNYGIERLLQAGASVMAITDRGDNILHILGRNNNVEAMKEILSFEEVRKVSNYKNVNCKTPLMSAVSKGNIDCVKLLLAIGADLNIVNQLGKTAAHLAAEKGYSGLLHLTLNNNSNLLYRKTISGESLLCISSIRGHLECVQLLLQQRCITKASCNHEIDQSLLDQHSLLAPIPDSFNGTPLHLAVLYGRLEVVKCLVDHDPQLVNLLNEISWCPLITAIQYSRIDCVKYLLEHGANLSNKLTYLDGPTISAIEAICTKVNNPDQFLKSVWDDCVQSSFTKHKNMMDFHFGLLNPSSKPPQEFEVLNAIVNCKSITLKDTLLHHKLTEQFLKYKWKSVGNICLITKLIFRFIYAILVTCFGMSIMVTSKSKSGITFGIIAIMILFLVISILNEFYLFCYVGLNRGKCKSFNLFLKWMLYVTSIYIIVSYILSSSSTSSFKLWQVVVPLTIILSWTVFSELLPLVEYFNKPVFIFRYIFHIVVLFFTRLICLIATFVICAWLIQCDEGSEIMTHSTVQKIFTSITSIDYSRKNELFSSNEFISPSLSTVYSAFITVLFIVYLLTNIVMVSRNSENCRLKHMSTFIIEEEIIFLSNLQIYLYDDKILNIFPRGIKDRIYKTRQIPHTISVSMT